jgi:aminopeptidase N
VKLAATGPLTLGHRLHSSRTLGGYDMVYSKGALVLRALHFLLSNPESGDDAAFFTMMKDFVNRHRNGFATTESFMQVAGEHFARSPIGRKYGMKDLSWFLSQWIYQTGLPTYQLDYKVEQRDGGFFLKATVLQDKVPEDWVMLLPMTAEFSGGRVARTVVNAIGPKTPIELRLPEKPQKVRLDPDLWIPSEKTSEKGG